MTDERCARLYARLRRPPAPASVRGTLPVLFFGDLFAAEIATDVICTGKTVGVHVRRELGVEVAEEGSLARIKWWVGHTKVEGRPVGFAGWNYPLARPTGLGAEGETRLGQLLADRLQSFA